MELKSWNLEILKPEQHPSRATPICIPLNNMDQLIFLPHIPYLFAFPCSSVSASATRCARLQLLRESLAKLLVEFYPLAGRVEVTENGKVGINCNNAGVEFYEAEAAGSLMNFVNKHQHDTLCEENALISPLARGSTNDDDKPLLIQVTSFECGGMTLVAALSHKVGDGQFFSFFLKRWMDAVHNSSAGGEAPQFWHEKLSPRVPSIGHYTFPSEAFPSVKFVPAGLLSSKVINLSSEMISKLQSRALENGSLKRVSRFEAVVSHLWRCFVQAKKLEPSQQTRMQFPVDARRRFSPPLPQGLSGNVSTAVTVTCSVDEVICSPHSAASLIRQASEPVDEEFIRSIIDGIETGAIKSHPLFGLDNEFTVSTWWKFPYCSIDFGWGRPSYVAAAFTVSKTEELPAFALAILLPHPDPRQMNVYIEGLLKEEMKVMEQVINPDLVPWRAYAPR